jgi:hypothetical protein
MALLAATVAWKNKFFADKKTATPELEYDEQLY